MLTLQSKQRLVAKLFTNKGRDQNTISKNRNKIEYHTNIWTQKDGQTGNKKKSTIKHWINSLIYEDDIDGENF